METCYIKILSKRIISIRSTGIDFFDSRKIHEMRRPMDFVVKFFRVGQMQIVLHLRIVPYAHKVVVPRSGGWHHEEAQKLIRQQHLHTLVVGRQITFGIVASILRKNES